MKPIRHVYPLSVYVSFATVGYELLLEIIQANHFINWELLKIAGIFYLIGFIDSEKFSIITPWIQLRRIEKKVESVEKSVLAIKNQITSSAVAKQEVNINTNNTAPLDQSPTISSGLTMPIDESQEERS